MGRWEAHGAARRDRAVSSPARRDVRFNVLLSEVQWFSEVVQGHEPPNVRCGKDMGPKIKDILGYLRSNYCDIPILKPQ